MSARLVLLLRSLEGGGLQRNAVLLARGFLKRGLEVEVWAAEVRGPARRLLPENLPVRRLSARGWWRSLPLLARFREPSAARPLLAPWRPRPRLVAALPSLVATLEERPPDALLALGTQANLAALLARRCADLPFRVVASEHNPLSAIVAHARRRFRRRYPQLIAALYPEAEAVVAVSNAVARDLAQLPGAERLRLVQVPNPVDLAEVRRKAACALPPPLADSLPDPLLVAVGRLHWQKGFDLLIRAMAELDGRLASRLVILGDGPERSRLARLIGRLALEDRVLLVGHDPNPWRWMARARVFVHTALFEGFGHAVAEALALGVTPVVVAGTGALAELLEEGRCGYLVRERSPHALASAIETALSQPIPPPRLKARAAAFAPERAVTRYLALLLGDVRGRAAA